MVDVIVIGGGLAGAAVAISLAERGSRVAVVDAEQPGSAATAAAAGMLVPQYESDQDGPLFRALLECRGYYPAFADTVEALSGEALRLRWKGMLVANLEADEHRRAGEKLAWQGAVGAAAELLEPGQAAGLQPGLASDALSYLWLPDEGQVDAQQVAELLPRLLEAAGVQLLGHRRGREVQTENGRVEGVVLTDDRFLAAPSVVLAAGAWSGLVGRLPTRIPVVPVRGHLLRYDPAPVSLGPIVAGYGGRVVVPCDDGSVLVGSTSEPSGFDRSTDAAALAEIQSAAARLVPAFRGHEPTDAWADLRPMPVDGLPIVGADPEAQGLFYATGYGRTGILMSPLAGRVVAELILDGTLREGWGPFSPRRLGVTEAAATA
jgi:glycine oxidase